MYVCGLHASSARSNQKRMPSLDLDLQAALRLLDSNPSPLQQQSELSTAHVFVVDFGKFVVALFCLFFRFCMILFLFYDSVTLYSPGWLKKLPASASQTIGITEVWCVTPDLPVCFKG